MGIPEQQLSTWSHQGSITQSSSTYATIKAALESADSGYSAKNFRVFLQGSYGNDTNIYSESDVDVVIVIDSMFHHDLSSLDEEQKAAFRSRHSDSTYKYSDFKKDVLDVLKGKFGTDVDPGEKAITVKANGTRRKADVLIAMQYRRYHHYRGLSDQSYDSGICFYTKSGTLITNYPKQHSENCTQKHQATNAWFKPMARIFKNLRSRLVSDGAIESGTAPSYYLEGLLYNVPTENFGSNYSDSFVNCINWLMQADRSKFVCANEQYYLLWTDSPTSWTSEDCDKFLAAAVVLWNEW
jgi:hypothetical protein